MTLLEKLLSSVAYAPETEAGAAGADPAAVEPAAAAAADPAAAGADPAAAAADPAASDPGAGDPPPAAKPHGNAGKQPWYMSRINEETNRRLAEASRAAQAEQRARDAEEMLSRLQRGEQPPAGQPAAAQPQRGAQPNNEDELNRVIHQTARAISNAERLQEDSTAVMLKGGADFADWGDTVNVLKAIGLTSDEIVGDVIAVDKANAHVIFDQLAKDPEKATLLTNMNPRQRIVEITRMSSAISPGAARAAAPPAPANNSPAAVVANGGARRISNAPSPPPPAAPAAASQKQWDSDEVSDEEFSKGWNSKYAKA